MQTPRTSEERAFCCCSWNKESFVCIPCYQELFLGQRLQLLVLSGLSVNRQTFKDTA